MSLAITYRRSGDPAEILEVTKIGEPPSPGPGQLQVQVSAFPIHPGDLMAISAMQTPGSGGDRRNRGNRGGHRSRRRGHLLERALARNAQYRNSSRVSIVRDKEHCHV